jgi:hypothetical protein
MKIVFSNLQTGLSKLNGFKVNESRLIDVEE